MTARRAAWRWRPTAAASQTQIRLRLAQARCRALSLLLRRASRCTKASTTKAPRRRPARRAPRLPERPTGRACASRREPTMPNYRTPEGAKKLQAELNQLLNVQRAKVVHEVAEAPAQGDRSEHAEYIHG